MLKKIKSIVVVKKLFFHIFDRIKLNLVKYNKKLQNYLNISLINYRIYNKIIFMEDIIYEDNTKGKIYDVLTEDNGLYGVIDDEEEDIYLYGKSCFEDVNP